DESALDIKRRWNPFKALFGPKDEQDARAVLQEQYERTRHGMAGPKAKRSGLEVAPVNAASTSSAAATHVEPTPPPAPLDDEQAKRWYPIPGPCDIHSIATQFKNCRRDAAPTPPPSHEAKRWNSHDGPYDIPSAAEDLEPRVTPTPTVPVSGPYDELSSSEESAELVARGQSDFWKMLDEDDKNGGESFRDIFGTYQRFQKRKEEEEGGEEDKEERPSFFKTLFADRSEGGPSFSDMLNKGFERYWKREVEELIKRDWDPNEALNDYPSFSDYVKTKYHRREEPTPTA
ncbi:hypothetical protein KEM52_004493, partial [Ascosphaera acerosa]